MEYWSSAESKNLESWSSANSLVLECWSRIGYRLGGVRRKAKDSSNGGRQKAQGWRNGVTSDVAWMESGEKLCFWGTAEDSDLEYWSRAKHLGMETSEKPDNLLLSLLSNLGSDPRAIP